MQYSTAQCGRVRKTRARKEHKTVEGQLECAPASPRNFVTSASAGPCPCAGTPLLGRVSPHTRGSFPSRNSAAQFLPANPPVCVFKEDGDRGREEGEGGGEG